MKRAEDFFIQRKMEFWLQPGRFREKYIFYPENPWPQPKFPYKKDLMKENVLLKLKT